MGERLDCEIGDITAAKLKKVAASPMFFHNKESNNRRFDGLDEGEATEGFEAIVLKMSQNQVTATLNLLALLSHESRSSS